MLRDLAQSAGLTPAQTHAYLVSYRKGGFVEQDAASGLYRLGPLALQLGLSRMRTHEPLRVSSEGVISLASELGLMVALSVWGTFGPTVVQVQEAARQVHVNVRAGTVFSVTGTATGRVFAAYLPHERIQRCIASEMADQSTQRIGTPISNEDMDRHIAFVRTQGYAPIEGQPVPGINAVAGPVLDHTAQVQCVITLIGPAPLLPTRPGTPQVAALLRLLQDLSMGLGHRRSAPSLEIVAKPVNQRRRAANT